MRDAFASFSTIWKPGLTHFAEENFTPQKACEISIKTKGFPRDFHGNNRISSKGVRDVQGVNGEGEIVLAPVARIPVVG